MPRPDMKMGKRRLFLFLSRTSKSFSQSDSWAFTKTCWNGQKIKVVASGGGSLSFDRQFRGRFEFPLSHFAASVFLVRNFF